MKGPILFFFAIQFNLFAQDVIVSGHIKEKGSGEALPYAHIAVPGYNIGSHSNVHGFFSIKLPQNHSLLLIITAIGYTRDSVWLHTDKNIELALNLVPSVHLLSGITIDSKSDIDLGSISPRNMDIKFVKTAPALMGEKDVFKTLQLLPGVQTQTEGFNALYVRGGDPSQNLILLDEAPIYNANHIFGLFSPFNGDAIKNLSFWKGGFPARYGDRASSVIDLQMKDGNIEEYHGEGGIGLISSRFTFEGPLVKDRSSFLVSTRRTYLDLFTRPFMSDDNVAAYRFYDFNFKINYQLDSKNRIYVSSFLGNDKLIISEEVARQSSNFSSKSLMQWGNKTGTIRWHHIPNQKIFMNITLLYSNFNNVLEDMYKSQVDNPLNKHSIFSSSINDFSTKLDIDFFASNSHTIKTGISSTHHSYKPFDLVEKINVGSINTTVFPKYWTIENAIYAEDTWQPTEKTQFNFGLRASSLIADDDFYFNLAPRVNLAQSIWGGYLIGASYTSTYQYVHLLSNTGVGLSSDLWVPASKDAPPQRSKQFTIGLSKDFVKAGLKVSLEGYRKYMDNIVNYQEGANFLELTDNDQNFNWKDKIAIGTGTSFGTEFQIQKNSGRLTGWLAYTIAWTSHQFDEINNGRPFYPVFDSRHNIGVLALFKASNRISISGSWSYHSGNALSVPSGFYYANFSDGFAPGTTYKDGMIVVNTSSAYIELVPYYGAKNNFRADPFHRLDVSTSFSKEKKRWVRYWEFGIFNLYSRQNPFYYYIERKNDFVNNGQRIVLKKKSLFPIVPSISYSIKF